MADDSLFRKAALDKLASPERLDVLMQVTRPRDRIATWTILSLILAVLAWAIWSEQPDRMSGRGAIQEGTGEQRIQASGDGTLADFELEFNQVVTAEQVVAKIESVNREVDIQKAEQELEEVTRQYHAVSATAEAAIAAAKQEQGRRRFERDEAARRYADYDLQVKAGDRAARDLEPIKAQMSSLDTQITQLDSQMAQRRSEIQQARAQMDTKSTSLRLMRETQKAFTNVISPIDGRVVSLLKKSGDTVVKGDVLAQIVPVTADDPLNVVAFVSAQLGQRIRKGQTVQILVNGIKTEEAGFLKGEVAWVSSSYASPSRVMDVMKEGINDPVYEVHVAPQQDRATISGYAWSTGIGPPQKLDGGSFVDVNVEVGTYAPISRLPAYLKSLFGV